MIYKSILWPGWMLDAHTNGDNITINAHYRDSSIDNLKQGDLVYKLVESSGRVVEKVIIGTYDGKFFQQLNTTAYTVTNPKHVFSYRK